MEMRERIINALVVLSSTRGLAAVTVDELARAAGISRRTIYRYFPDKEHIIEEMVDRMLRQIQSHKERVLSGPGRPRDKLRLLVTGVGEIGKFLGSPALADIPRHYPDLFQKIDSFRAAQILTLEQLFAEGVATGDFRPVDPAVAAAALLGLARAILNPEFILHHSLSTKEALALVIYLFLHGLATCAE